MQVIEVYPISLLADVALLVPLQVWVEWHLLRGIGSALREVCSDGL